MDDGKLKIVMGVDDAPVDRGVAKLEKRLDQAERKVKNFGDSLDKSSSKLGDSLGTLAARYLSVAAAISAVTRVGKSAVELNANFERKNAELASVLGSSIRDIKDMSKAAEDLGRVTEFTASEVTELQLALARLGFTKTQIKEMQGTVLQFAAAVNADLGRAANFAGAALRGFGLEAKDSTHLLDVMAAATTKSALDFSKLETSISIVAPIAHTFGLTVEDTVTLLGALSNAGFDASSAATATRNILLNLADANGKLAKGLGHTARTFPEIIDSLKECNARGIDLSETLEMTDKRSVSAFNALITGAASADELRQALGSVDGTLEQMYGTMTENLIGATKKLQSAWEGLMLKFQDSNGPMANAIEALADGINKVTDNADEFGRLIVELIATFGAYKAALITINALKAAAALATKGWTRAEIAHFAALTAADKAQKALNKTILKNPYALAAAAVAGLAFGIYKMVSATSDAEKAMKKLDKADKDATAGIIAETAKIDTLFAKLKAAREGTEEYDRAKQEIMSKYGQYLTKLGDEKTALDDIALAYKTITEEASKAAKARAFESFTASAADDYGKTIADVREDVYKLLQEKFGDQKGSDGVSLAETYFWKIVPVLEGKQEISDELKSVVDSFDKTVSYVQGTAAQSYSYTTNAMQMQLSRAASAAQTLTDVMAEADRRFGERTRTENDFIGPMPPPGFNKKDDDTTTTTTPKKILTDAEKKEIKRYGDAFKQAVRDMWMSVANTEIEAMEDGYEKRLAEIENEKLQSIAAIKDEQKKLEEAGRKSGNKIDQTTLAQFQKRIDDTEKIAAKKTKEVLDEKLQSEWNYLMTYGDYKEQEQAIEASYNAAIEKEDDEYKKKMLAKQRDDALFALNDHRLQYLAEYGNIKEQELAITEKYNALIAKSNNEWEKKSLAKQRDEELSGVKLKGMQSSINWSALFGNIGEQSTRVLSESLAKARALLSSNKGSMDVKDISEMEKAIASISDELSNRNPFAAMRISMQEVAAAKDETVAALEEYKKAQQEMVLADANYAIQKSTLDSMLNDGILTQEEYDEQLKSAQMELGGAQDKLTKSTAKLNNAQGKVVSSSMKFISALNKARGTISTVAGGAVELVGIFDDDVAKVLGDAIDLFEEVGDTAMEITEIFVKEGEDIVGGLQDTVEGVSEGVEQASEATAQAISAAEAASVILLIIKAAIKVVTAIFSIIKANNEATERATEAARKYKIALEELNDAARLDNLKNAFGEDGYGQFIAFNKQLQEASNNLDELEKGMKVNQKVLRNWGALLLTAGLGVTGDPFSGGVMALKGVVEGVGKVSGQLVADMRSGWQKFWGSSKNIVTADLADFYDENGKLNGDKLKAWYDQYGDYLDDQTKHTVDSILSEWERYEEAMDGMSQYLSGLFNGVAENVASSMVDAFLESGDALADLTDLAKDFGKQMAKSVVTSMLMEDVFNKDAQEKIKNMLLANDAAGAIEFYNSLLDKANSEAPAITQFLRGLNLQMNEEDTTRTGATNSGITASQDSVDEQNARLTTIQGHTYEMKQDVRTMRELHSALIGMTGSILKHVMGIHKDTEALNEKAGDIIDGLDSIGSDISRMKQEGVTIKR